MKLKSIVMANFFIISIVLFLFTGCARWSLVKTDVDIVVNNRQGDRKGYEKLVKAYESEFPNLNVKFHYVDDFDEANSKFEYNPPCIYTFSGIGEYREIQDYLLDISDCEWLEKFDDYYMQSVKGIKGAIYGMPININGYGFLINREIFEEAGIDIESMFTFNGMNKAFAELKRKIDAGEMQEKYPELRAVISVPAKEVQIFGAQILNPILAKEFKSPLDVLQAKDIKLKYANLLKEAIDFQCYYAVNNNQRSETMAGNSYEASISDEFFNQRVACVQQGNLMASLIKELDRKNGKAKMMDKIDIIPYNLPDGSTDGKYVLSAGQFWGINKNISEDKIYASKIFLEWVNRSEKAKKILEEDCGFLLPWDIEPKDTRTNTLNERIKSALRDHMIIRGDLSMSAPYDWIKYTAGNDIRSYIEGSMNWQESVEDMIKSWKRTY